MSLLDHLDIDNHQREIFVRIAVDCEPVGALAEELKLTEEAVVSLYSTANANFETALARLRGTFQQDASKAPLLPFLARTMIVAILKIPEPTDEEANERLLEKIVAKIHEIGATEVNLSPSVPDHHTAVAFPGLHKAPRRLH